MKACDFLQPGETIIAVFTDGTLLEINEDHTGGTGNWSIDPSHSVDRVIIYQRAHQTGINSLYIANHAGVEIVEENKYKIKLAHIQYVGITNLNWNEFADTGTNPIRYIS